MSEAIRRMTLEEFDAWQPHQDVRCELVDGLVFAMTGATFAHDIVVGNLFLTIGNGLAAKGSHCRPFTADIGFKTGPATLRRPDLAVYCPPFDLQATRSTEPVLVAEVLSPSTERVDQMAKLQEYRAAASLHTILILAPDLIEIGIWRRQMGDAWQFDSITDDASAALDLTAFGFSIAVRAVYAGAELRHSGRPRLVWDAIPKR